MMWAEELDKAKKELEQQEGWPMISQGRQQRLQSTQVIYHRLQAVKADRAALVDCLPLARALFSKELEDALNTLLRQFWLVQVDADTYGELEPGGDNEHFIKKVRRGMYELTPVDGEANEITDAINASVATIERTCEPALRLEAAGETSLRRTRDEAS